MSNLAVANQGGLVDFNQDKIRLIKQMFGADLTDTEFEFFISVAKARGLDPVLNQIHAVKRKNKNGPAKMTIQVGIDGFRLIASRTNLYAGKDEAIFEYKGKSTTPDKVTVTVYKIVQGIRCAFTATARWQEYVPAHEQGGFMWVKMPEVMLEKVCEAKALRMAFPGDLSGLYVNEEMHQAETPEAKVEKPVQEKKAVEKPKELPESEADQYFVVKLDFDQVEERERIKKAGFMWSTKEKVWYARTSSVSDINSLGVEFSIAEK
jgi:phage recombination protein Bet